MARTLQKAKARRETGPFLAVPRHVIDSPQYVALSAYGVKLLFDLYAQFRGNNNGDLSAAWSLMKQRGWHSKGTLSRAVKELLAGGWIIVTRQGGRHKPSLYALTFQAIDECGGKLDVSASAAPPGDWKKSVPRMRVNVPRMRVNRVSRTTPNSHDYPV